MRGSGIPDAVSSTVGASCAPLGAQHEPPRRLKLPLDFHADLAAHARLGLLQPLRVRLLILDAPVFLDCCVATQPLAFVSQRGPRCLQLPLQLIHLRIECCFARL